MSDILLKVSDKEWKEIVKPVIDGKRFGRLAIGYFPNYEYRHKCWIVHRTVIVGYFIRCGQYSWMKARRQIKGFALWNRNYVALLEPVRRPKYKFPKLTENFDIDKFKRKYIK